MSERQRQHRHCEFGRYVSSGIRYVLRVKLLELNRYLLHGVLCEELLAEAGEALEAAVCIDGGLSDA